MTAKKTYTATTAPLGHGITTTTYEDKNTGELLAKVAASKGHASYTLFPTPGSAIYNATHHEASGIREAKSKVTAALTASGYRAARATR